METQPIVYVDAVGGLFDRKDKNALPPGVLDEAELLGCPSTREELPKHPIAVQRTSSGVLAITVYDEHNTPLDQLYYVVRPSASAFLQELAKRPLQVRAMTFTSTDLVSKVLEKFGLLQFLTGVHALNPLAPGSTLPKCKSFVLVGPDILNMEQYEMGFGYSLTKLLRLGLTIQNGVSDCTEDMLKAVRETLLPYQVSCHPFSMGEPDVHPLTGLVREILNKLGLE